MRDPGARFYLSRMIGTGAGTDGWRPVAFDWAANRKGRKCKSLSRCHPITGTPLRNWTLCRVWADDLFYAGLEIDPRNELLCRLDQLADQPDGDMATRLSRFGITIDPEDTRVHMIVTRIGRLFDRGYRIFE